MTWYPPDSMRPKTSTVEPVMAMTMLMTVMVNMIRANMARMTPVLNFFARG